MDNRNPRSSGSLADDCGAVMIPSAEATTIDAERPTHRGSWSRWNLTRSQIPHADQVKPISAIYLSTIAVNLLGLVLPLSMLQVYDRIIPNAADATLGALISILLISVGIEAVLRVSRLQIDHFNAAKFSLNVTVDAFGRMLNPHSDGAARLSPRKTIDRLDSIARLGGYLGGPARQVAVDLPFSAVFFLAIGIVGGWLVLIPVAIASVFGVMTFLYGRALAQTVERKDANDTRVFDFITEVLGGISTVKGLSAERMMMRRFEHLGRTSAANMFDNIVASERATIMAGWLGNLTTIAIATVGATMAVNGSITIGTLAACSLLAGRAVQPTLRVAGIWNEWQRAKLTLREASRIFALPPLDLSQTTVKYEQAPEIRLIDVHCSTGPGRLGFQHVDLTIAPNEIASFCGPNGIGKSTLLNLVSGLREPESGYVLVDGLNASKFRSDFVNSVGFVSAQTEVFRGTILENLMLFGAGCNQEMALQMCQTLGLEDEIYGFPDGYSTMLGGNAVESLPKGFIQRLVLARALAQKPRILILDEAQGFLDPKSDLQLRESLKDLQFTSTIALVTNRAEYLELSSRVFDISVGDSALVVEERSPKGVRAQ